MTRQPPLPPDQPPPPFGQPGQFQQPPQVPIHEQYPGGVNNPLQQVYEMGWQSPKKKRPLWQSILGVFVVLAAVGGLANALDAADPEPETLAAADEPGSEAATNEAERAAEPTTTSTRPTTTLPPTTVDQNTEAARVLCDSITDFLDDNPDARVIHAIGFATAMREALIEKGYDPSVIGRKAALTCRNGYNNEAIMGYGGFGPVADAVDYTLDRGVCGSRGDLGGVIAISGFSGRFSVELELSYVANGIVEHQTSEYVDVEGGGNGVAFEFYIPSVPAGGECEVSLVSVKPE